MFVQYNIQLHNGFYLSLCSLNLFCTSKKVGRKKKTFFVSLTLPVVVDDNSHRSSSSSIRCSRCIVSLRRRRLIPHAFHHQFHKVLHLNEKLFAIWKTLFEHIPFYTILY